MDYVIRIPANKSLELEIEDILYSGSRQCNYRCYDFRRQPQERPIYQRNVNAYKGALVSKLAF